MGKLCQIFQNGSYHYYERDYLGSTRAVLAEDGTLLQDANYYPGGLSFSQLNDTEETDRLHCGKEWVDMEGLGWYDNTARFHDAILCRFTTPDPLLEQYPHLSPYAHCANNPLTIVDPDGRAWHPTFDDNENVTGFEWVEPEFSYDENGNLHDGLYEQAIFFSENYTFNPQSKYNIGSSTATVYNSDGTTETFDACTYPSDLENCATIPDGLYEAKVGTHRNYTALRLGDVGTTNFYNNTIELEMPNPSDPSRTYAQYINIHKPGYNNLTGKTSDGRNVSEGCLLIDRTDWNNFIGLFSRDTIIGVSVSRNYNIPMNK